MYPVAVHLTLTVFQTVDTGFFNVVDIFWVPFLPSTFATLVWLTRFGFLCPVTDILCWARKAPEKINSLV